MELLKKNLLTIINRIEDEYELDCIAEALEEALTEMQGNDTFGTEGQCDPRGDFRNGVWSVWEIEDS